jgi:hypothetical protein
VVGPGVGDHAEGRADDPQFAQRLEPRLQGHAFDHQRLGAVAGRDADHAQLFDHIRESGPEHRQLGSVRRDQAGLGAGRLRIGADAVGAQRRGDEPHHRRLSARAVYVDADRDRIAAPRVEVALEGAQRDEEREKQRQRGRGGHRETLAESSTPNNPSPGPTLRYNQAPCDRFA